MSDGTCTLLGFFTLVRRRYAGSSLAGPRGKVSLPPRNVWPRSRETYIMSEMTEAGTSAGTSSSTGYERESSEAKKESESQHTPTPKRKKYVCVFCAQLTKVFAWARPSKKGST